MRGRPQHDSRRRVCRVPRRGPVRSAATGGKGQDERGPDRSTGKVQSTTWHRHSTLSSASSRAATLSARWRFLRRPAESGDLTPLAARLLSTAAMPPGCRSDQRDRH
jgi:hypothetical protein